MKLRNSRILITAASALLLAQAAFAQDQNGTWSNTAGGTLSWTTPGNWDSNAIANGSGFTANFVPPSDIAADTTVALDGAARSGISSLVTPTPTRLRVGPSVMARQVHSPWPEPRPPSR
jgi:hypothetical protein